MEHAGKEQDCKPPLHKSFQSPLNHRSHAPKLEEMRLMTPGPLANKKNPEGQRDSRKNYPKHQRLVLLSQHVLYWISMLITRMADGIGKSVGLLSTAFDDLSTLQGEALTEELESGHEKIKKKFAEITKLDIALNNLLVRARLNFFTVMV